MRALISVTDKSGLEDLCRGLRKNGWVIAATSGTAAYLRSKNIPVDDTSALTGFAEMLGGRVKTLHPAIFGGILARETDKADIKKFSIPLIDMVAVNFYKLKKGRDFEETIDIGGLALLRAAAKNYKRVICVCDPNDYKKVLEALEKGVMDEKMRRALAIKTFNLCALYNKRIVDIMSPARREFPEELSLSPKKIMNLRYGENPHQKAAFYSERTFPGKIIQGKAISYNNMLDIEAAILPAVRFAQNGCVIIKHTNPCGAAAGAKQEESYKNALACDRVSAFGGIVSFNRTLTEKTAALLNKHFFEVIAAPDFDAGARKVLARKPKLILFKYRRKWDSKKTLRSSLGGYLVQEAKFPPVKLTEASGKLTKAEKDDIMFGLNIAFSAASNASVVVKGCKTIGICSGQCSRIESVKIAIRRAIEVVGKKTKGTVLVSDGFFPFDDSVRAAAASGIKVVAAPSGSVKDSVTAETSKKLGVKLAFVNHRLFRH